MTTSPSEMVDMEVELTPDMEAWIEQMVASGRYMSASEVCQAALRLHMSLFESLKVTRHPYNDPNKP